MSIAETHARITTALREVRKAFGLTQVEFAEELGASQSHVSKLENGIAYPTVFEWLRFCTLYGIPSDVAIDESALQRQITLLNQRARRQQRSG